jgi:hypothetical protein
MKTIEVTDEVYDKLVKMSTEMKTQDNRATASPFYFQVQTKKDVPAPDSCGETQWINEDGDDLDEESMQECMFASWPEDKIAEFERLDEWEQVDAYEKAGYRKVWFVVDYDYQNCFYTLSAIQEHLRINKHNYREPKTYISYGYRNAEMEFLHKFLFSLTEDKSKKE